MADMYYKQNDTRPAYEWTLDLRNADDLTNATGVEMHARKTPGGTPVLSRPVDITDTAARKVLYTPQPGDTAVIGTYEVEFQVAYDDGGIETIPGDGSYFSMLISDDIA